MIAMLMTLFVTGIELSGIQRFLLMPPLCLCIAIVYKTTRCESLRDIPLATIVLWITIVIGMYAVGLGLWALFAIMA
jgi:hypothetical protein